MLCLKSFIFSLLFFLFSGLVYPVFDIPTTSEGVFEMDVVTENIPLEYRDFLALQLPAKNQVTLKSSVVIKGHNKLKTQTFVNGALVRSHQDGRFFQEVPLNALGKQTLLTSFVTPDLQFLTIGRKLIRLYSPLGIENVFLDRKRVVYFFNSDFLYNPDRSKRVSDVLTRADLAFFVSKLFPDAYVDKLKANYEDVDDTSWMAPYIGYVRKKKIMLEFPDGQFKPQNAVKKLEYIVTLVRAYELPMDQSLSPLPFKDVDQSHWASKFIRTALNHGLIEPAKTLNMDQTMTYLDLVNITRPVKEVSLALQQLIAFEDNFDLTDAEKNAHLAPVLACIEEQKERMRSYKAFSIARPQDQDIVFDEQLRLEGHIYPVAPFYIDDQLIESDVMGNFSVSLDLKYGKNSWQVMALDTTSNLTVYRLDGFDDLDGHWAEEVAAKFRYLGLLKDDTYFYPQERVTRAQFSRYLVKAFDIEFLNNDAPQLPNDLSSDAPDKDYIVALLETGVMSLDAQGNFFPLREIKRSEAITAILRAQDLDVVSGDQKILSKTEVKPFPFWDVPKSHWVRDYVQRGLDEGIISEGHYFRANDSVYKAELITMLSKTAVVEAKMNFVFSNEAISKKELVETLD